MAQNIRCVPIIIECSALSSYYRINFSTLLGVKSTFTNSNSGLFVIYPSEKKTDKMNNWSGGDWLCGACQHQNFKKRDACQRCGYPKSGGPDAESYLYNRADVLAGDWFCAACGAHNYASRTTCYRCNTVKIDYGSAYGGNMMVVSEGASPPGWKTGDWLCST